MQCMLVLPTNGLISQVSVCQGLQLTMDNLATAFHCVLLYQLLRQDDEIRCCLKNFRMFCRSQEKMRDYIKTWFYRYYDLVERLGFESSVNFSFPIQMKHVSILISQIVTVVYHEKRVPHCPCLQRSCEIV